MLFCLRRRHCVVVAAFRDAPGLLFIVGNSLSATASQMLLDAMTNGSLGFTSFVPIDNTRYDFSLRPADYRSLSNLPAP